MEVGNGREETDEILQERGASLDPRAIAQVDELAVLGEVARETLRVLPVDRGELAQYELPCSLLASYWSDEQTVSFGAPYGSADHCRRPASAHLGEPLVDLRHGHRPFAHRRGDALRRAVAHVADGEDTRDARLEAHR